MMYSTSAVRCGHGGLRRVCFGRRGFFLCPAANTVSRLLAGSGLRNPGTGCCSSDHHRGNRVPGTARLDVRPTIRNYGVLSAGTGPYDSVWPPGHSNPAGRSFRARSQQRTTSAEWSQRQLRRMYSESRGQVTTVLSLKDPVDLLNFFIGNESAATSLLVTCMGRLARVCPTSAEKQALTADERFHRLVDTLALRLEDCEARQLAELGVHISQFYVHVPAVQELARRVADVVVRRENAFTPKQVACLAYSFSWCGGECADTVGDFLVTEAMKVLAEMDPGDLSTLYTALQRMRLLNRDTANLIFEKLTDDVDRFTCTDVVSVLRAMASTGVSRGFLLRRISTLVFDNMDSFHPRQLASIFESLALLRFLTLENAEELLARLSPTVTRLPTKYLMNILNGLVVLDFPRIEAVRTCVDAVSKDDVAMLPRTHAIGVAHALLQFQMYDKNSLTKELLEKLFQSRPLESRLTLGKLEEIINALDLEKAGPTEVEISPQWRAAVDQKMRADAARGEQQGVLNELTLLLDSMRGKFQLQVQRNQQVGPYWVQFVDEETKICLELDSPAYQTRHVMKARHLKQLGYHYLSVDFWQWRRLRSEADQIVFLKQLLSGPLLEIGRLDGDGFES